MVRMDANDKNMREAIIWMIVFTVLGIAGSAVGNWIGCDMRYQDRYRDPTEETH